jgi:transglutaminase-like putative cysteine protease
MILEVQHETRLEYTEPVTEALTELRMEPASDADQSCCSFHLAVSPAAALFRDQDGFCNRVHHYNVRPAHQEARILAASIVQTHPQARALDNCRATYPLDLDTVDVDVLDFLNFRGPVCATPRLTPLVTALRPGNGTPLAELVLQIAHYINGYFEYARDVTLANSPIDDVLEKGKGVCQDFTHLMIALLRTFAVPARYVSGYVHRPNKESQSHAWCEAWLPGLGWVGVDPTNDCLVGEHHIKVGFGRDFTDVPPNKGVYRGRAKESISVRVETRALERLPSLLWQEQLPPLMVPLVPIVYRTRPEEKPEEEEAQQQQQ